MPTRFPIVFVQWEDAEHDGAWGTVEDEEKHDLGLCSSVGWLIHENAKRLVLAASISQSEIGNKQYIPVKMITKRMIIKKAKALPKPKKASVPVAEGHGKGDPQSADPVKKVRQTAVD